MMKFTKAGKNQKKKNTQAKRYGISEKMMIGVAVPIVVLLVVLATVITAEVVNVVYDLKNENITNQSDAAAAQIPEYFNTFFVSEEYIIDRTSVQQIFREMENSPSTYRFENSQSFNSLMRDLKYAHEVCGDAVQAVWISGVKNNQLVQSDGYISDSGFNVSERVWYKSLQQNPGESALSPVYVDASTGKLVLSAVTPYYNSAGEMIGVVGMDISLDAISEYLGGIKIGDSGYVTVYDPDFDIIYHPDSSLLMNNLSEIDYSDNIKELIEGQTSEVVKYERDGTSYYGRVFYLEEFDWSVLTCMPADEYTSEVSLIFYTLVIGFLACIVISALICLNRTRALLKPLKSIGTIAQEFAKGNLNSDIRRSSDDEIGDLEEVFAETQASLKEIISDIGYVLREISNKNLTVETSSTYRGDFAQIEQSLQGITYRLNDIMSNIDSTAIQVDASANQVSDGAQALAQGSTEQATSVERLAFTINEALERTKQMAGNAQEASQKADNAGAVMQESNEKMNLMMQAMNRINKQADEISKIIKAIEDIAFQTNILALNAAVEAARAGVAGKGFAVVADEVRNLAAKSAEASNSTATMIASTLDAVKDGMVLASDASESLAGAAVDVKDVVGRIGNVSSDLMEHAQSMEELSGGVGQISNVIQMNSATAQESAAVSQEMSAQATNLKQIISEFNIK